MYVQEDKSLDTILLRFSVSDSDDDPNAGPFTFDIRSGNEDNAFRVVQDGTLRTATTKYNHKIVPEYRLQVSLTRLFEYAPYFLQETFVRNIEAQLLGFLISGCEILRTPLKHTLNLVGFYQRYWLEMGLF